MSVSSSNEDDNNTLSTLSLTKSYHQLEPLQYSPVKFDLNEPSELSPFALIPSSVAKPRNNPEPNYPSQRKTFHPCSESANWAAIGYGGDLPRNGSTLSGLELESSERYQTMNGMQNNLIY